jgi:cellulose synthase/poly-beta-1,6-N-acetylglucosamine synthase-like glycosyltransferase
VRPQLSSRDRLVVVADNCSDRTADVAQQCGVEVVVRNDTNRVGKGYALQAGCDHLLRTGLPAQVVFIDSDCVLHNGALDRLSIAAEATDGPVQALYLMHAPVGASARARFAEFSWLVRNHARPLGLFRLGLGCPLLGSGILIPSDCLRLVTLGTGHIVEDTVFGIELALHGRTPEFCEAALVTSEFPPTDKGLATQRARWIHGNLQVMLNYAPALVLSGLRRRDWPALALGIDLLIPPLTLLLLLNVLFLIVAAGWSAVSGHTLSLSMSAAGFCLLCLALLMTWFERGRHIVPLADLRHVPKFFVMIAGIIASYCFGRRSGWTRSDRS